MPTASVAPGQEILIYVEVIYMVWLMSQGVILRQRDRLQQVEHGLLSTCFGDSRRKITFLGFLLIYHLGD